jgi:hypothetical protein
MKRFTAAILALAATAAAPAHAHVKWFADWSLMCPPRDPTRVFSSSLWQAFFVAAVLVMAALALLDARLSGPGSRSLQASDRLHARALPWMLPALRIGLALYWTMAAFGLPRTVYLTPELSAPAGVAWLQAACALLVLHPRTAWIAGLALIGLYGAAIVDHGWFHLLDYPIFLCVGIALVLTRKPHPDVAGRTLALLRWGAAITLLWGGVEKFAYPEWSFAMLAGDRVLSLGVDPETAMFMYGFGEIALSFGLLFFGVGGQVSAALLLAVFVAAVPKFGWLDLVGHSGIIVVLILLTLTRGRPPLALRLPAWHVGVRAALFPCTVGALCVGYFALHALYLPGAITQPGAALASAAR